MWLKVNAKIGGTNNKLTKNPFAISYVHWKPRISQTVLTHVALYFWELMYRTQQPEQ